MEIIYQNIAKTKADIIVNAANGIGFMGGWIGKYIPFKGVAESLHYQSKGSIEKEAKRKAKKTPWVPRIFWGRSPGECYVTGAGNLSATWIIHAVTMRYPGMPTSTTTVKKLLPVILQTARSLGAKSVAIPLLGTGTGGLNPEKVLAIYQDFFKTVSDIDVLIILFDEKKRRP